jgi:hypothetical protein
VKHAWMQREMKDTANRLQWYGLPKRRVHEVLTLSCNAGINDVFKQNFGHQIREQQNAKR